MTAAGQPTDRTIAWLHRLRRQVRIENLLPCALPRAGASNDSRSASESTSVVRVLHRRRRAQPSATIDYRAAVISVYCQHSRAFQRSSLFAFGRLRGGAGGRRARGLKRAPGFGKGGWGWGFTRSLGRYIESKLMLTSPFCYHFVTRSVEYCDYEYEGSVEAPP
jgi:hypothetical protein